MTTITCPKCGTENPADAKNCENCRINLKFALQHPDEIEHIKQEETRREQVALEPEVLQPEKREAKASNKRTRLAIWLAIVIGAVILWNTALHPLWDTITYWDGGDFAGQPIYQMSTMRISKTLHNELEKCGLGDGDLDEIDRLPQGRSTITKLSGGQTRVYVIWKVEITTGIVEVTCDGPD
jgi:hypothetical protein